MKLSTPIPNTTVIIIAVICSIITFLVIKNIFFDSEHFTNASTAPVFPKGNYLEYLMNQKSPGYFNKKLATVTDANNGTLRIQFPEGSCGKDRTQDCGISAVAVYPSNFDNTQATFSADVLFEPGFAFDQGKLGIGLEMGTANATGGHGGSTASSCRVVFKNGGGATCYIYVPLGSKQTDPSLQAFADGKSTYGKEFFGDIFPAGTFKIGVKNSVAIGVKMNTPGNADGECFMTINGVTGRKQGIMWLTDNVSSGITRVNNSQFIGGSWLSSKLQYIQMSNMRLVDNYPVMDFSKTKCTLTRISPQAGTRGSQQGLK